MHGSGTQSSTETRWRDCNIKAHLQTLLLAINTTLILLISRWMYYCSRQCCTLGITISTKAINGNRVLILKSFFLKVKIFLCLEFLWVVECHHCGGDKQSYYLHEYSQKQFCKSTFSNFINGFNMIVFLIFKGYECVWYRSSILIRNIRIIQTFKYIK